MIDSDDGKKYLMYALGEIALVVVGILIALQINNWNEWRKDRVIETDLLIELHASVENNKNILERGLRSWQTTTQAIEILEIALNDNLPFEDSLAHHFREAHRKRGNNLQGLDFSGYKALENKGYDILTNKDLRRSIVSLFETNLPMLSTTNDQIDFDNSGFHSEYIIRNFISKNEGEYPINYEKIRNDQFYISILKKLNSNLSRKIGRVKRTLPRMEEVLKSLEEEIKRHKTN